MRDLPHVAEHLWHVALDQPATLGDGDCESLHQGWWGQPVNTVTSFAYVGAGAWLASRISRVPARSRTSLMAYAAFAAITGVGSVAYHGPQFDGAQLLHDVPILGVFGIGAAVPLLRRRAGRPALPGWSNRLGLAMAAAGAVAGVAYAAGDTESPACHPESVLQYHGLWHMGTAAVIAMWGAAVWAPSDEADGQDAAVSGLADAEDAHNGGDTDG